jgi:hypothetical protein
MMTQRDHADSGETEGRQESSPEAGGERQPPLAQSPDAEPEEDAQPGGERDWLPSEAQSPDDME